ncbi:MAG: phosphatidate cytidylyltransferase [Spirochaetia bacterium]|nr:phosphatidate cytidylyltransferase [Spirochaetia bacterium]
MNETPKRIVSGLIIAIVYGIFFSLNIYAYVFLFFFIIVVVLTVLNEFYFMFLSNKMDRVNVYIGRLCAVAVVSYFYFTSLENFQIHNIVQPDLFSSLISCLQDSSIDIPAILLLFAIMAGIYNILSARINGGIHSLGIIFFGIIYIPLSLSFIFLLRGMYYGIFYIWLISWITVMTDIGGYAFGKMFGKHKLPLPVSPNKSWEGYAGAFFTQLITTILFNEIVKKYFATPDYSIARIIIISSLLFATAIIGDLFESLVKRNAHAKDSGNLLPGHGGLLDRVDSIMFALPVFYYYLLFTN